MAYRLYARSACDLNSILEMVSGRYAAQVHLLTNGGDGVVLSAIVKINAAAEVDNSVRMFECLAADDARIANLDASCREKYHRCLFKAKVCGNIVGHPFLLDTGLKLRGFLKCS